MLSYEDLKYKPKTFFTIHPLSSILNQAFSAGGYQPARLTEERLSRLAQELPQDLGIDGTERRINRPGDDLGQRLHYSGKKMPYLEEQSGGQPGRQAGQILGRNP